MFEYKKSTMRKITVLYLAALALILFLPINIALSNESINAQKAIEKAGNDIAEMQSKEIPILRVNESLTEAIQFYSGQVLLEENNKTGNYKLVMDNALKIEKIKEKAIKASDELKIFREAYENAKKENNLSSMESDYNEIELSFTEERFEDTLLLIDAAYNKISDLEASQTALKLFYDTTSRTLQQFFIDNWNSLLSGKFYKSVYFYFFVFFILILIFWTTLKKLSVGSKMKHLMLQKATLNSLIKKMQYDYFKLKKISEIEYKVKTDRFKEMIRDIDRQIPLLKETLAKLDKEKIKISKN